MYAIIVELSLRINQRVAITVAADATFEIGSGEMKIQRNITKFSTHIEAFTSKNGGIGNEYLPRLQYDLLFYIKVML